MTTNQPDMTPKIHEAARAMLRNYKMATRGDDEQALRWMLERIEARPTAEDAETLAACICKLVYGGDVNPAAFSWLTQLRNAQLMKHALIDRLSNKLRQDPPQTIRPPEWITYERNGPTGAYVFARPGGNVALCLSDDDMHNLQELAPYLDRHLFEVSITLPDPVATSHISAFESLSPEAKDLIISAVMGEFTEGPPTIPDDVKAELKAWADAQEAQPLLTRKYSK